MKSINHLEDYGLSAAQLDEKYNAAGRGAGHPYFTRADWRHEVSENNTLRGYWDWVAAQLFEEEND